MQVKKTIPKKVCFSVPKKVCNKIPVQFLKHVPKTVSKKVRGYVIFTKIVHTELHKRNLPRFGKDLLAGLPLCLRLVE